MRAYDTVKCDSGLSCVFGLHLVRFWLQVPGCRGAAILNGGMSSREFTLKGFCPTLQGRVELHTNCS